MTVSINGTTGLTFNDSTSQTTAATCGLVNKIINGDMMIDQRNAGASVTPTSENYTLDRWVSQVSQTSKFSVQQNAGSVTPPSGFTNYLGATSLSAYSIVAGDYFTIEQRVEGFNTADLGWGTASASTVTLSFWVRSSLTGTFGGSFTNSGNSRSYPFTYTISSANTWEQKSITIAGDTSGTWLKTNGQGITIYFSLGMGSTRSGTAGAWAGANYLSATGATSVVGTNGATFYITGVDLRKGTTGATAQTRDVRPYGTELALCQRYYYKYASGTYQSIALGSYTNSAKIDIPVRFAVTMRTSPSLESGSGTNYYSIYRNGGDDFFNSLTIDGSLSSLNGTCLYNSSQISGTGGQVGNVYITDASGYVSFSAEL